MPSTEIYVQKNDGLELKVPVTVDTSAEGGWDSVKDRCARKLFKEEELYSIQGPHEIKMFRCPSGNDEESRRGKHGALRLLKQDSLWSVEIFGGPFRTKQDVGDELVRNITSAQRKLETQGGGGGVNGLGMVGGVDPGASMGVAGSMSDCFLDPNQHIHVTTFLPMLQHSENRHRGRNNRNENIYEDPPAEDYDSALGAMLRCRRWLQAFVAKGHKVTVLSMQSVLLPANHASPAAVLQKGPQSLYKGMYDERDVALSAASGCGGGIGSSASTTGATPNRNAADGSAVSGNVRSRPGTGPTRWVQGARVWFCFPTERTVHVKKRGGHIGLQPVRQEEGWIVVRALEGSPCAAAGMPVTAVYLTHVNEEDVSPHSFPSLAPKSKEAVTWETSVLPLVLESDTFSFTFFE